MILTLEDDKASDEPLLEGAVKHWKPSNITGAQHQRAGFVQGSLHLLLLRDTAQSGS